MFTVITPTSHRLPYLKECIASVQGQVLAGVQAELEHIVLVSEPDAATAAWVASGDWPATVRVVEAGAERLSPAQARNRAIAEASNPWILLLDDDDVFLQRTAFHFTQAVQAHPERRWFVSDFLRVDAELRYQADDYYAWPFDTPAEMLQAIFRSEHFLQGNVCFQKSLFEEAGGYDESLDMAEDLELYVRFLLKGALPVALPFASHLHRMHEANISRAVQGDKHFHDLRQMFHHHEEKLQKLMVELALPTY